MHKYTEEELQFLREHTKGTGSEELTKMFNEHFGLDVPVSSIRGCKKNHNLASGVDTKFGKGHTSHNKGRKLTPEEYEKMRPTMFKKGHKNASELPIGSIVLSTDGYNMRKISDQKGPNNLRWKMNARLVWEEHHGPIPDGMKVLHKNGIRTDDRIENLMLVTHSEQLRLNRRGLMTEGNVEINEAAIALAKLDALTGERRRTCN